MVLTTLGAVTTGFTALFLIDENKAWATIQNFLHGKGLILSNGDSLTLAQTLNGRPYLVHVLFGHALFFLVLLKLLHMVYYRYIVSKKARNTEEKGKNFSFFLLFFLLVVMVCLGETLAFHDYYGNPFGLSEPSFRLVALVHRVIAVYIFFPLIVIHVGMIFIFENRVKSFRGSVSKMIGGEHEERFKEDD